MLNHSRHPSYPDWLRPHTFQWCLLLFFLLPLGKAPVLAEEPGVAPGMDFIWKIEGSPPSYLIGTVHTSDQRVANLTRTQREVVAQSKIFMPEIDLSMEAMQEAILLMLQSSGASIRSFVEPELAKRIELALGRQGIPASLMDYLHPSFVAVMLSMPPEQKPQSTLDYLLHAYAEQNEILIQPLETIQDQLAIFLNIEEPLLRLFLKNALDEQEAGYPSFERLIGAWLSGKTEAVEEFLADEFSRMGDSDLVDALLYRRNRNMAEIILRHLPHQSVAVAVGIGHLVGEESIPQILTRNGYNVRRLVGQSAESADIHQTLGETVPVQPRP